LSTWFVLDWGRCIKVIYFSCLSSCWVYLHCELSLAFYMLQCFGSEFHHASALQL
jgi:hypothetical protein